MSSHFAQEEGSRPHIDEHDAWNEAYGDDNVDPGVRGSRGHGSVRVGRSPTRRPLSNVQLHVTPAARKTAPKEHFFSLSPTTGTPTTGSPRTGSADQSFSGAGSDDGSGDDGGDVWTSCTETVEGAGVIGADGALEALRLVGAIDAVGDLSFSELVAKTRQLRQQGGTEGARARGSSPFARSTSPSKQSMLQKARLLGRRHHKDHGDINVDGSSPRRDGGRGSTLTPLHTSAGARGARNVGIFALTPTTGSPTTGATTDDDDDNEEGEESDDDDDNGGGWGAHTGHATAPAGGNGSTNSKQGFGASTGGVGKDRGAPEVSTIGNGGLAD